MTFRTINMAAIGIVIFLLIAIVNGQDRRPTISFITQPEIVTDIGGTIEMKCSVQVRIILTRNFENKIRNMN